MPLPAALILLTPEIDLAEYGDSLRTLLGVDTAITASAMPANLLYPNGQASAEKRAIGISPGRNRSPSIDPI